MKVTKSESITITDCSDEILKQLESIKPIILEELGLTAEAFAKSHETAVDTGRLRNSITHVTASQAGQVFEYHDNEKKVYSYSFGSAGDDNDAVYIGTNVEYAPYIEFGTSKRAGIHFLEKALKNHTDIYTSIIKKHLDQPT